MFTFSSVRLKQQRLARGLSQAEVAAKCGVSREMWGKYERGLAVPGSDVLARLDDAGIDAVYVMTGNYRSVYEAEAMLARNRIEEEPSVHYRVEPVHSAEEAELLINYRNATDDGKAAIRATARAVLKIKSKGE